jgi:peroxiredoxin (alkyl hydroperoxide reductase subunit C)
LKQFRIISIVAGLAVLINMTAAHAASEAFKENIYNTGQLKPTDSTLKVKVGDLAPDFTLPSVAGEDVTLSQYRGKKTCGHFLCTGSLDSGVLRSVAGI